jgi:hypothetical protein
LRIHEPEFVLKKRFRRENGRWRGDEFLPDCAGADRLDDDHQIGGIGKRQHLVGLGAVRNPYHLVTQVEFKMVFDKDVGDAGAREDRSILIADNHHDVLAGGRCADPLLLPPLGVHRRDGQQR